MSLGMVSFVAKQKCRFGCHEASRFGQVDLRIGRIQMVVEYAKEIPAIAGRCSVTPFFGVA